MRKLQDLLGATPAPAVQLLPARSGRRLLQPTTGVQAQVNVQSSTDIQAAVAAALQEAVSSGQFQAALNLQGQRSSRSAFLSSLSPILHDEAPAGSLLAR